RTGLRQGEAILVETESVVKALWIEAEEAHVIALIFLALPWFFFAPGLHGRACRRCQFLAKPGVEAFDDGEGVLLKGREMDVEEAIIIARIAKGNHASHAQLAKARRIITNGPGIDTVAECALQFIIEIRDGRGTLRHVPMRHDEACIGENLVKRRDEQAVRGIFESPAMR